MILDENFSEKPEIEYPCQWGYKLIGKDKEELEASVVEVLGDRAYSVKDGNSSSKGKFHSINMECRVESQEDRDTIFKAFQENDAVKMVI